MPFTPFHFGPGLATKMIAPSYFSFMIFVFSQVLIDLEPLYFIVKSELPVHRFFHTYLGATVIAVVSYIIGRPLCGLFIAIFKRSFVRSKPGILEAMRLISPLAALTAAFIGSYSHIVLDSIMHSDINPLSPFSEENVLLNSISVIELHLYCFIAGIVGAIGRGFRWLVSH